MAIALDITTSSAASGFVSSLTWSHTCTGSNLILVVFAAHAVFNNGNDNYTATYNGVSMTQIQTQTGNNSRITAFYLVNPATGAHNVVVTPSTSSQKIMGASLSYTGAKQSGQPDSSAVGTGSGTDYTASTTVVLNNTAWTVIGAVRSLADYSAGTSTTLREHIIGNNSFYLGTGDSNGVVASGAQSLHLTGTSGGEQSTIVFSIAPSPITTTLAIAQASYALTAFATGLAYGKRIVIAMASFTLTAFATGLTGFNRWTNQVKNTTSFTNQTKD